MGKKKKSSKLAEGEKKRKKKIRRGEEKEEDKDLYIKSSFH